MAFLCKYTSKPCFNQRSLKANGQLHSLCLDHRYRANDSQRRWQKRRLQRQAAAGFNNGSTGMDMGVPSPLTETEGLTAKPKKPRRSPRKRLTQRGRVTFRDDASLAVVLASIDSAADSDESPLHAMFPESEISLTPERELLALDELDVFLHELASDGDMVLLPSPSRVVYSADSVVV